MIDRLLRNIVGNETGGHDVAILMSGGTDSCTLLFTALRLGKKVHCYTFRSIWTRHIRLNKSKRDMRYI